MQVVIFHSLLLYVLCIWVDLNSAIWTKKKSQKPPYQDHLEEVVSVRFTERLWISRISTCGVLSKTHFRQLNDEVEGDTPHLLLKILFII